MDLQLILWITALATILLELAQAQQQPQIVPNPQQGQQGIHQMNQKHQGSHFRNKQHIQDKDHILEHLEEIIDKPESEMTEQELQLHYFKLHDYDNNNKLDGLELIQALTHYHHEDGDDEQGGDSKQRMTEKDMEELIDPILAEEDENGDGYIDYPEFAKTQSN